MIRKWHGGRGRGFLIRDGRGEAHPVLEMWEDNALSGPTHAEAASEMRLDMEHVVCSFAVNAENVLLPYTDGQLHDRSYIDWILELEPRLRPPEEEEGGLGGWSK